MNIIKTRDYQNMSRRAAGLIFAQIVTKPDCVLGLATGSTPLGIYRRLIGWYQEGDLDFSRVTSINLDEYKGLPQTNSQSYYRFMEENLFRHINILPENTFLPNGMEADSAKACKEHELAIHRAGGIDLQLLGLGHNGHIGFNEPGDFFEKETHCVTLSQSTIEANSRFFESPSEVPTQAYTMGIGSIMSARSIVIAVSGPDKADIVSRAFFGPVTPRVPASILQMHPNVTLVADQEALSACPQNIF